MTVNNLEELFSNWFYEVEKDLQKRGGFWSPALVSGSRSVRTVVLRGLYADASSKSRVPHFIIHTDVRSRKWKELTENPAGALHFYCAARRWQMRVGMQVTLAHQDAFAEAEWGRLSDGSRKIYSFINPPGIAVDEPQSAYAFSNTDNGFDNFGVLKCTATALESLQLEQPDRTDYHVRAHWDLVSGQLTYLAP